jgi:hypothetical protein
MIALLSGDEQELGNQLFELEHYITRTHSGFSVTQPVSLRRLEWIHSNAN